MLGKFLQHLTAGRALTAAESEQAVGLLLTGRVPEDQIVTFLQAMATRGETEAEVHGAARALRTAMVPFPDADDAFDCVGTGGDARNTYNVSTATCFVLAGAGLRVAKHGNRAVSSRSGAADILTELGMNPAADAATMHKALHETNLCFLLAPLFHPAMRHVAAARKTLGTRSLFNLLGPLVNPARVRQQLVGVFAAHWLNPFARILKDFGSTSAWVVNGMDGLDELTTTGITEITALTSQGDVEQRSATPEKAGLRCAKLAELQGGDPAYNAAALRALLDGTPGAYRDIVLLNAAACFIVAGRTADLPTGVALAAETIDSGAARRTLRDFITITGTSAIGTPA